MFAAGGSLARTRRMSYTDRHAQVRLIDLMEAVGHVPRTVTAPGKQLLTDTEPLLRMFADELFAVLAPAEMVQLTTLLAR